MAERKTTATALEQTACNKTIYDQKTPYLYL